MYTALMNWLKKRHGRLVPPGLEITILRKLPLMTFVGTLLIVTLPVLARTLPVQAGVDRAKHIKTVDIFAIATEITLLTAVFTVAIGCVVVHIMKGPAYIADPLPVSHSDKPKPEPRRDADEPS